MGRGYSRLVPEKTAGALPFIRKAAGGFLCALRTLDLNRRSEEVRSFKPFLRRSVSIRQDLPRGERFRSYRTLRGGDSKGGEIQKDGRFKRMGNSKGWEIQKGGKFRRREDSDAVCSRRCPLLFFPLFFIMNDKETEMPPVPEKTMFLCTK